MLATSVQNVLRRVRAIGLGTRLVALPLGFTTAVAMLTAKRATIGGPSTLL